LTKIAAAGDVTVGAVGAVSSIVNVVSGVESAAPPTVLSVACALTVYEPAAGAAKAYAQLELPPVTSAPHPRTDVVAQVALLNVSVVPLNVVPFQYVLSLFRLMLTLTARELVLAAQLAVPQIPTVALH